MMPIDNEDIPAPEEYISEIQYPDGTVYKVKDSYAPKTRQDIIRTLGYTPYDSTNPNGYITSAHHDSTKQDAISDLATIRNGASLGATAIQQVKTINGESIVGSGDITIKSDLPTYDEATETLIFGGV